MKLNAPVLFVVVDLDSPVFGLVSVTRLPTITCPDGPATDPVTVPVAVI